MIKRALGAGVGMLVIGGYFFVMSMLMITDISLPFDWIIWTIYLTVGIVLISVGPGLIAWAFVSKQQRTYELGQWQVFQLPTACSECKHSLEIHSLEWIGPEEARCPFCSSQIQIRRSIV